MQQREPLDGHCGFATNLVLALAIGAAAAAILSPFAAWLLALGGFSFPFPRIFDRVAMATIGVALLAFAGRLRLGQLLRAGFRQPRANWRSVLIGSLAGLVVVATLSGLAIVLAHQGPPPTALAIRAINYLPAAFLIGVIEETFFRAILLGGLAQESDGRVALLVSSMIYASAHLLRSPRHFYLKGLHPLAGFANFLASLTQLLSPGDLIWTAFGLFLLGLVLGQAFLRTGRVYFSIGLHAGVVVGAKCWPIVAGSAAAPQWLAGPGPVPLIAAPAGWIAALLLFGLIQTDVFGRFGSASEV
jgi:membrane protease YdiL (CAAX protease family)